MNSTQTQIKKMAVDATSVVYLCPFCEEQFPSDRGVRIHIKHDDTGDHKGVNGFEMDRTIETKEKIEMESEDEIELHRNIATAGDHFDELGRDEVCKISDAAGVHYSRVLRVFEDEGIEYNVPGRKPSRNYEDLTPNQKSILDEWGGEDDRRTWREVARDAGIKPENTRDYISKYGWMILPIYDGEVDGAPVGSSIAEYEGSVRTEGVEEAIKMATTNGKSDHKEDNETDRLSAFVDSGVDFEIVVNEEDFEAMRKLIESGYDDIARDMFEGR